MLELFIRLAFMIFYVVFNVTMMVYRFTFAIFLEIFRAILNGNAGTGVLKAVLGVLALGFLLLVVLSVMGG